MIPITQLSDFDRFENTLVYCQIYDNYWKKYELDFYMTLIKKKDNEYYNLTSLSDHLIQMKVDKFDFKFFTISIKIPSFLDYYIISRDRNYHLFSSNVYKLAIDKVSLLAQRYLNLANFMLGHRDPNSLIYLLVDDIYKKILLEAIRSSGRID